MHLSGIRMCKFSDFKINYNKTTKLAMEEEEIDPVPLVTYTKPFLPTDKSEIASKLQKKIF